MTIEDYLNQNSVIMMYIMSCHVAGSMSKHDNRRQAKPEFCDDGIYNVMLHGWEYE